MTNGSDRIKSALEIALEKAQKLGALSEDEKQRQKDEELMTAAEALAKRYLNGLPLKDIDLDLARYKEEERGIVRNHLLSHLVSSTGIGRDSINEKILAAIEHILPESELAQTIGDILHEYQYAMDRARRDNLGKLESEKLSELERKGISGSAVEPAIETSSEWTRIQQDLSSQYEQRLEEIKRSLSSR